MAFMRLLLCVSGVYSCFLLWAVAQERLSVPFASLDGSHSDKFNSVMFLGTCQSALSVVSAFLYMLFRRKTSQSFTSLLGLDHNPAPGHETSEKHPSKQDTRYSQTNLLLRYLQCSVFITSAAPFGFASLSYISYPAMVLGKSCKLVPVMIMNVLLYRRKFAPHKYLVVAMVTVGITVFMGLAPSKPAKAKAASTPNGNLIGLAYLLINLAIDGATNSTQDEIFARHRVTGQQMMFWINLFSTLVTVVLEMLPLPYIPVIHPSDSGTEWGTALAFIREHPSIKVPLLQFAITGALGQLFIFETLQHFGSLTLVTITLTRKIFTMLLSVVWYGHKLSPAQWLGAGIVFAGISVEAFVKTPKGVHVKKVVAEKEVAKLKSV
ncbi:hypothetical protein HMN09_01256500 [Mycena chlorophos]|uniref:UDP-galactose transporter homolog 1 n=1 Tax=Mycena chlorophos TaxID=658473 RepID=A0A8H6S3H4_MYCCL|nr:hypothetical protein HMN09_01256500 [Mycena chlorophos]